MITPRTMHAGRSSRNKYVLMRLIGDILSHVSGCLAESEEITERVDECGFEALGE